MPSQAAPNSAATAISSLPKMLAEVKHKDDKKLDLILQWQIEILIRLENIAKRQTKLEEFMGMRESDEEED